MRLLKTLFICTVFLLSSVLSFGQNTSSRMVRVSSVEEILMAVKNSKAGDSILVTPGVYQDIQLSMDNSGTPSHPIVLKAATNGTVTFSGDVKIDLRGNHLIFEGCYFKNGNRSPKEWKSHGPGLIAIYGSYNRITQCAFHAFDEVHSAYITTSLTAEGTVPQYCRIDHCSFTDKTTFDQVINLNNTSKKSTVGMPGTPMYHRVDHCYFSNPKKPGNAGGGIRIGYWRKDFGRCMIDNNLFERQDSEPEIITSKSQENIFYKNTFKNCRGTLNFRHGDSQVAIHNFFVTTDTKHEYGGMFVWGSNHIIAGNYFQLTTTIKSRGNAALYLNSGIPEDEHALAYNIEIINNQFVNTKGYAIDFQGLKERRVQRAKDLGKPFSLPHHIQLSGNVFFNSKANFDFFNLETPQTRAIYWKKNLFHGAKTGIKQTDGLQKKEMTYLKSGAILQPNLSITQVTCKEFQIEGIDFDIQKNASKTIDGYPLSWKDVGPDWLKENPSSYAQKGKLTQLLSNRLKKLNKK